MNATDRDDTAQKIAEIREALEKAKPGARLIVKFIDEETLEIICDDPKACANLFINAPEWLRFLLDELEQAQKELDRLIGALKWLVNEYYKCAEIAWRKWKTEADMYEQGKNHAFDDAAQMLEALLKEHGVTVE